MIGDKGRETSVHGLAAQFDSVSFYSGRAIEAATLTEASELLVDARERALVDVIGHVGFPKKRPGFAVAISGSVITIRAGRMYVEGARFELPQDLALGLDDLNGSNVTGEAVVLACCDKTEIDFLDDPFIRDPGLGGPDTAGRKVNTVQFHIVGLPDLASANDMNEDQVIARMRQGLTVLPPESAPANGKARFDVAAGGGPQDDECRIYESGGYNRNGNFNYLVQIHKSGAIGTATFKWARDYVRALVVQDGSGWALREEPSDDQRRFRTNDTIEVKGVLERRFNLPGVLGKITIDDATGNVSFTADAAAALSSMQAPLTVTRWDNDFDESALAEGIVTASGPLDLENGIQVRFSGTQRAGDYWYCAARVRTSDIIWPPKNVDAVNRYVRPFNWGPKCVGLRHIELIDGGIRSIGELRPLFPDLTHLTARDVTISSISDCDLRTGDTVQDALERLCAKTKGLCSITVRPNELDADTANLRPELELLPTLEQALAALKEQQDNMEAYKEGEENGLNRRVALRFLGGTYVWSFDKLVILQNLHSVSLKACDAAPVNIRLRQWLTMDHCLNVEIDGINFIGETPITGLSIFGGKSVEITNSSIIRPLQQNSAALKLAAKRRITLREVRATLSDSSGIQGVKPAIQLVDARAQTLFENVQSNGALVMGVVIPESDPPVAELLEAAKSNSIGSIFSPIDPDKRASAPNQSSPTFRMTGCKILKIVPDELMAQELIGWSKNSTAASRTFPILVADQVHRTKGPLFRPEFDTYEFFLQDRKQNFLDRKWSRIEKADYTLKIGTKEIPQDLRAPFRAIEVLDCEIVQGTSILVANTVTVRNTRFTQYGEEHCYPGNSVVEYRSETFPSFSELDRIRFLPDSKSNRPWFPICLTVAMHTALDGNIGYPEEAFSKGNVPASESLKQGFPLILDFGPQRESMSLDFTLRNGLYDMIRYKMLTFHSKSLR